MEKYRQLREISQKKIKLADHMLTMTYPVVKDPKLLVSVMENIFLALTNAIGSLLHYERTFKKVPQFEDTFISKFRVFKENCAKKYKIEESNISLIQEIKDIVLQHKKSPIEFTRKDSFVICSDDYIMQTITLEKMKTYILKSKSFLQKISNIIERNNQIYNKEIRNI
jgi:hypothetical protein